MYKFTIYSNNIPSLTGRLLFEYVNISTDILCLKAQWDPSPLPRQGQDIGRKCSDEIHHCPVRDKISVENAATKSIIAPLGAKYR